MDETIEQCESLADAVAVYRSGDARAAFPLFRDCAERGDAEAQAWMGALYANGWLWVKLTLVTAYIVLGILAFRPQRSTGARWALVVTAGLCFLQAYFIARFHHPLGALLVLTG